MCENLRVWTDASIAPFTTFGIGGKARKIVVTDSPETVRAFIGERNCTLIGGGSNLLVGDNGFDGTLIRFCASGCELAPTDEENVFYVSAATRLPALSKKAAEMGLSGLEWACGIPGTLGGAIKMNAGAYGSCIGSCTRYADILTEGRIVRKSVEELSLSYRKSGFEGIVLGVAIKLTPSDKTAIEEHMRIFKERRAQSQPSGRSAGSVYRAHKGISAYRYIIGAGLSGLRVGGAIISPKHANFIVNDGNATARDVLTLMHTIEERVKEQFGVELTREIELIGEF